MPQTIFEKIIVEYPNLVYFEKFITERKEDNWGQIKAGTASGKVIKMKLKYDKIFRQNWIKKCKKGGINNIKKGLIENWESGFRNIGRRKFIGPNNEKMFTKTERKIALFLKEKGISYEYEPKITINNRTYFPDFIVKNIIIERCGLFSKKYVSSLKRKLKDYLQLKTLSF